MGQAAHYLEAQGFSTVTLTNTPEFHRQVGIPRVAAIEYPYGRPVGQVHDREGQREVLLGALSVLENAKIMAERIPDARMRAIEEGGHLFVIERPQQFNKAVIDFLDGLS